MRMGISAFDAATLESQTLTAFATDSQQFNIPAGGRTIIRMTGYIVAGTAGTFGISWAQFASSATATTVERGSYIEAHKVV